MITEELAVPTVHPVAHDCAAESAHYVCCRCLGSLSPDCDDLLCNHCGAAFPVYDGVPYFVFSGEDWYRKLRETVVYRDFYLKLKQRRVERDRMTEYESQGSLVFHNLTCDLESAFARLDFSTQPRVLDVGGGCGEMAQYLSERGAIVDAVDYCPLDLHHDPRWLTLRNLDGLSFYDMIAGEPIRDVKFRRAICDADYLPFSDNSFDVIFIRATVHHVFDMRRFFRESNRVLKPGGMIMIVSEPLSSIFDNLRDYHINDLDYEEGLHEMRPRFNEYHSALRHSGFGHIEVQISYASWGARLGRRFSRYGRLSDAAGRIAGNIRTGRSVHLLNAFAGGMNLFARKRANLSRAARVNSLAGEVMVPLVQALHELSQFPETAQALLRQNFPDENKHASLSLGLNDLDAQSARGLRPVESIQGRFARYLLTKSVFHLSPRFRTSSLCIDYNAEALPDEPQLNPKVTINGKCIHFDFARNGWRVLRIPLFVNALQIAEMQIEQLNLTSCKWQRVASDNRDVGLAISRIWLE